MGDQGLKHLVRHRRIERRGRFIQDQQIGATTQGQKQGELGPHSTRERLDPSLAWKLEPVDVALLEVATPARKERRCETDHLVHGHVVEEILLVADESRSRPNGNARLRDISGHPKNTGLSARGPSHAEEDLRRRGLTGAVASEIAKDRPGWNPEIDAAECLHAVICLSQLDGLNCQHVSH